MGEASITAGFAIARSESPDGLLELAVTASAGIEVDGLRMAVNDMRAALVLGIAEDDGVLSLAIPNALELSPPTGALAELVLPGFRGGGYLEYLAAQQEWRGALTALMGPVSVDGFLIVSTDDQFSLLVLLTAEFSPPIQLSFGFTLVGVGGMVGINRRPDQNAITAAAADGTLSRLLFPADPVAEAPQLLPVLDSCFPASPGDFIVGPMLKIGWGTPTLVAATVGVLVCSTGILVVGRVAITLPFEQAALIRLEALLHGEITPNEVHLAATLANSHIVGIPVQGDLALLIRSGPAATFALSAGGFHPDFTPPDKMTGLRRIGTEISAGPVLHARLGAYLAVTTNSVQFGANAELSAGFAGFEIHGGFDFDALIVLDPFSFAADFVAYLGVEFKGFEVAGIRMTGHFSGPAPYCITGHARAKLGPFRKSITLPKLSWGAERAEPLPPARDPLGVLVDQLRLASNWAAGESANGVLSRLNPAVRPAGTVAHPLGVVAFQQSAVPLGVALQRMDAVALAEPITVTVTATSPGLVDEARPRKVEFPPAQFFSYDKAAALASSGYVSCTAGFEFAPGVKVSGGQPRVPTPETTVLGRFDTLIRLTEPVIPFGRRFAAPPSPTQVLPSLVNLRDPGVAVIASTLDLSDRTGVAVQAAGAERITGHLGLTTALLDDLAAGPAGLHGLQAAPAWEVAG